jgi:deazaflavin-dependent oxidoreductase (nitroreductase family)
MGLSRLGLSFGGKGPVVLTVPGRKSGRPRSTPVTAMTVNGKRYVVQGVPGSDWVANARAAREATLRRGRHTERIRMVEVSPDDAQPLLRVYPTEVPAAVGFVKSAGLVKHGTPEAAVDRAHTHPDVSEAWEAMGPLCEARDQRGPFEFENLDRIDV